MTKKKRDCHMEWYEMLCLRGFGDDFCDDTSSEKRKKVRLVNDS